MSEVAGKFTVVQVRSAIGSRPRHRATLRALGLGGVGKTNTLPDTRGMIAKVPHLVKVNEAGEAR